MDDKLKMMQDLLDEIKHLNNLAPSLCTKSADAHSISDDIIHVSKFSLALIPFSIHHHRLSMNIQANRRGYCRRL